jgi:regulator of sigma D
MSTTRAFDLKAPTKFDSFKNKNSRPAPETSAPTSAPKDNLLTEMAIDTKNSTSNGNHATIDFQGDFRPIFMIMCYYAARYYDALDVKQSSKVSPPTLVAYFLFVMYSCYLLCDMKIRPTPSTQSTFMLGPEYLDLEALLLSLPVPDFLVKLIQAIAPASDPRRPNISYIPSFACFNNKHDFGRYFPIGILLQAHNFVINNKTNDAPHDLINKLLGQDVTSDSRIGNYFGQLLHDGTNNYSYGHQLMQSFEGIINPALARTRSQRNVYSRINYFTEELSMYDNPYEYLMAIDENNLSETVTTIRQIKSTIESKFKITGSLSSVMASATGLNITIHSYSDFAVPTWHSTAVPQNVTSSAIITAKSYCSKIGMFKDPPKSTSHEIGFPTDSKGLEKQLLLADETDTKSIGYPASADTVKFTPRHTASPPIRVLDPYDYNATTFHNVILSGAMIESLELDSSIVPQPNTETSLDDENTLFLQSAIPYSDIHRASSIAYQATTSIWFEKRTPIGPHGQPATTLLHDSALNRLPIMRASVVGTTPSTLPGFHPLAHVLHWTAVYNRLSFRIPNPDEKKNNRPPLPTKGRLFVWSPYRYYNGKVITANESENYFMLTNLRTIFGTNPSLGEIAHFLETIPV